MVMHDTTPARLRYMMGLTYHWVHAWKNRRRWTTLRDAAPANAGTDESPRP